MLGGGADRRAFGSPNRCFRMERHPIVRLLCESVKLVTKRRPLLFTIGFALGALLFLIGGVTWQPPTPKCPGCAVLSSHIDSSQCAEAVQGGWVCQ